ncbi:hypothetical protein D3C73_1344640 [compost metagenome]
MNENVSPKIMNGIGPEAFVSINCGRKDRKNKDTLGFVRLVNIPCMYIFLGLRLYVFDALKFKFDLSSNILIPR